MNYQNVYLSLMKKGQEVRSVMIKEKHHIVPKCMGGSNDNMNISYLTPREHYVAHRLLCKIYPHHKGLIYALWRLSRSRHITRLVPSRAYEYARLLFSQNNPNKELSTKAKIKQKRKNGEYKYDYEKVSNTLKTRLSSLTNLEKLLRVQKALNCDQEKRKQNIRKGKSSQLQMCSETGKVSVFFSYECETITGYKYNTVKYHIRCNNGRLPNGNTVSYINKYTTHKNVT